MINWSYTSNNAKKKHNLIMGHRYQMYFTHNFCLITSNCNLCNLSIVNVLTFSLNSLFNLTFIILILFSLAFQTFFNFFHSYKDIKCITYNFCLITSYCNSCNLSIVIVLLTFSLNIHFNFTFIILILFNLALQTLITLFHSYNKLKI